MSIKNILVAYNGQPGADAALHGAVKMQALYGAHLTGLFAYGSSNLAGRIQPWMPQKVQDALLDVDAQSHQTIRDKFADICRDVPADRQHWIENKGSVQQTVAAYARLYDITVLGTYDDGEYGQEHIAIRPERLTLESGRPVVSMPAGFDVKLSGRHVIVAWDGGRAAARALADTMQVLKSDDTIEIVSVGRLPLAQTLPDFDVAPFFERHSLCVKTTELPRDRRSIAETLADHCKATGAALLVMGAYEHSPLREGLIGGVTQEIGSRIAVPIFMSH